MASKAASSRVASRLVSRAASWVEVYKPAQGELHSTVATTGQHRRVCCPPGQSRLQGQVLPRGKSVVSASESTGASRPGRPHHKDRFSRHPPSEHQLLYATRLQISHDLSHRAMHSREDRWTAGPYQKHVSNAPTMHAVATNQPGAATSRRLVTLIAARTGPSMPPALPNIAAPEVAQGWIREVVQD